MGRHFEFFRLSRWSLDRADVPVVRRDAIRSREGKCGFQVRLFGIPIDDIGKLHPLSWVSARKPDRLLKLRAGGLA